MNTDNEKASKLLGKMLVDLDLKIIFSVFDLQEAINNDEKREAQDIASSLESDLKQLYEDLEQLAIDSNIQPLGDRLPLLVAGRSEK